ncbi:MAG: hypothetical protein NTW54_06510 [Bacteroidetes bacterium]|nr:hypothetical protein [Bacteroidota bacterium]
MGFTIAFFILIIVIVCLWFYLMTEFPLRKKETGFEYVYVEEDGSVRELYRDEIEYLKEEFSPADSGRPYIKYRYNTKTPDNKICGFIKRRRVPKPLIIKPINQDQARLDELYNGIK